MVADFVQLWFNFRSGKWTWATHASKIILKAVITWTVLQRIQDLLTYIKDVPIAFYFIGLRGGEYSWSILF